jgi:hypothetical protein
MKDNLTKKYSMLDPGSRKNIISDLDPKGKNYRIPDPQQ